MTFAAAVVGACTHAGAPSLQDEGSAPFAWVEGCWQSDSGSTREIWTRSHDGLVFGHSVTLRDGELVFFEDLRIEAFGEPGAYVASPAGRTPVRFTMTRYSEGGATFENPDHDDPQRISYTREGDQLAVQISLMDGSNRRTFGFTRCPTD